MLRTTESPKTDAVYFSLASALTKTLSSVLYSISRSAVAYQLISQEFAIFTKCHAIYVFDNKGPRPHRA